MDDANVPSLLGGPLAGYISRDDARYRATRSFVLSPANPYYYVGRTASGIGSPHTPRGWVWPLSLIARALTADSPEEAIAQVRVLALTDSQDGLIHESFDPNDPRKFTRAEFGWGNAMFAELLFREAAGFIALPTDPLDATPFRALETAPSPRIADRVDQLVNRGLLLTAFEKVCPFPTTGIDPQ
jgi:meiotically up-regulated gene 157 (Mug157) protein